MRILVTGGAGFIGSHLVNALLLRGDEVVVLDDLSTGSIENLRRNPAEGRQEWISTSVMNRRILREYVQEVDLVFHLAAAVGVRRIIDSPLKSLETNIRATEVVLQVAAETKTRVFVASTSEVYGKNGKLPFQEDADLVMGPTTASRWSYACSKAIDEFMALAYWKEKRLPVVIGRLFNVVGPRQTGRYGMVLPTFISQALEGKPLTVFGDGQQRRCFADVNEVVEAIIRLTTTDDAVGEVVNIGNDEETTIESLAWLVKERVPGPSGVRFIPYDEAYEPGFEDMYRRTPCLDKLVNLTGFRPTTPLRHIVDRVANHMQNEGSPGVEAHGGLFASRAAAQKL